MSLEETIFFYTRNDYLIINNLLCGNMNRFWEAAEIANHDSKGVLKEYEDGLRELDNESVLKYRKRIYEKLDDATKEKIIMNARGDIGNILRAVEPAERNLVLYRNIRTADALPRYNVNEAIAFPIISSTSIAPYDASYNSKEKEFYRYEIHVSAKASILELDQFEPSIRNENGEILLPPMKCRVVNTRISNIDSCVGIAQLEYVENIPALMEQYLHFHSNTV